MTIERETLCERSVIEATDGHRILVDCWRPEGEVRALLHVFHGLSEHAARYDRFARECVAQGYAVAAHNHRGHGENCAPDGLGHYADRHGWDDVISDALQVQTEMIGRFPGVPLILFGHSMGSYIAQSFVMRHPANIDALALSASTWPNRIELRMGRLLASIFALFQGRSVKSEFLDKMGFGKFNKPFAPNRTDFDWLSRDPAEVDKYIADPLCGAPSSNQLWRDLLAGMLGISTGKALGKIADLPILIMGGELDPVGGTKGLSNLSKAYRATGHTDVTLKMYADGRHEMLNETNRDEVTVDIVDWCDAVVQNMAVPASA
jgi:alpha-beta hydrolase superfamily lysophospholipase